MTLSSLIEQVGTGRAQVLSGRGVNQAFRVGSQGQLLMKVHCLEESGMVVEQRLLAVDELLRGKKWYPPLIDLGRAECGSLIVVREFVSGCPVELSPATRSLVAQVVVELAAPVTLGKEGLKHDFATPWLEANDPKALMYVPDGRSSLQSMTAKYLSSCIDAARRLSADSGHVHHGDLQVRNVIVGSTGPVILDWDEAGISSRPSDAAKSLWLMARLRRGHFELDPEATRAWFQISQPETAKEDERIAVALLGALWFLPKHRHIRLLARRDPSYVAWYLKWIESFWSSLEENLMIIGLAK